MAKKQTITTELVKLSNVAKFELNDTALALAARFGLSLTDAKETRVDRAALNMNRSMHCMVAAGLDLASLQADCEHGEFLALITERGFEQSGAYRAIKYTEFLLSRSDDERERLLAMPKSKVLALAAADMAVIDDLMADEEGGDLDTLSVRELRLRIRELQANNADLSVHADAVAAERDGALKRLNKRNQRDDDDEGVPAVIADLRAELTALLKKAELAVTSLHPVGVDIVQYSGHADVGEWVKPTLRLGLAGLLAQRELIDGSINSYVEAMGEDVTRLANTPDPLAYLSSAELKELAAEYANLTAAHHYEGELRKHERNAAKPQGKGRPSKAPEAPVPAKKAKAKAKA